MKNIFITLLYITFIVFSYNLNAQSEPFHQSYDWDSIPQKKYVVPIKYINEPQYRISLKLINELVLTNGYENIDYQLSVKHEKIYINSIEAIEQNNRIILSFFNNEEIVVDKVRVIKPNGKIITIEEKDIQEAVNENTNQTYKYYAVKGLEKGAIVERLTISKDRPYLTGDFIEVQNDIPTQEAEIRFVYPDYLEYKYLASNISEKYKKDTLKESSKIAEYWQLKDIPILSEDPMANDERFRKIIFYKLTTNHSTYKYGLNSFQDFTDNFRNRINPIADKNEKKAINKFFKETELSSDQAIKIRQIEDLVKDKIKIDKYSDDKNSDAIIEDKIASKVAMTKLLSQIFTIEGIPFQVFFTTNRFQLPFDEHFESYEFLREIGFFFPKQDAYIAVDSGIRYPYIPDGWTANNGLFFTSKKIGNNTFLSSETKYIPTPEAKKSSHNMKITVDFTKDINNPEIIFKNAQTGYSAIYEQTMFDYADKKYYDKVKESLAKNSLPASIQPENVKIETKNEGFASLFINPFVMELNYSGKSLMENIGDKKIFNVGQLIGPQMQLYQEEERKLPVEKQHKIAYDREITLLLPDDYEIINLDEAIFDIKLNRKGKQTAWFTAYHSKDGNKITITNQEYYTEIFYPLEDYTEFAAVINAAADFNKLKFILKKK